jgi:protocatechuate 3,4-dioxygenase beta subunit
MHLRGLARTNTPGQFDIPALPPGRRYGVIISAPGHGQKQMTSLEVSADPGRQELDPVELKPANLALAGQVLDMDDKPVAGISVNLSGDGQPMGNVRTDREGRFRFSQVCDGMAQLYANAQNSYGNITTEGGNTNVVLRLGERSSSSFTSRMQRLKGVVTDPDGNPVSGAQVAVFPNSGARVRTGTNGVFNLTWLLQPVQLQSGSALLVVRDAARNLAASEALETDATNIAVKLKPALTVRGQVKTPADAPLPGAQVELRLRAGNSIEQLNEQMSIADAQGRFEINCLPPDMPYMVFATAKGYGRNQQNVTNDSETNRLELEPFVLKPADKVVAGQVVDGNDKPVSGAHVQVLNAMVSSDGQPQVNVTTDSKGRFRLQVCEGRVRLITSSQNGIAQASVEAGDTNVVLTLTSRSVSGARVLGEPVRRATLQGRPLPDLSPFGLPAEAVATGKSLLVCLLDAEQRPCRRASRLLAEQHDALREKGVAVVAIQAVVASAESFQTWTNSSPLPFPVGRIAEKSATTRWASEVESFPWFILRDAQGKVAAEGFALEELDTKLTALKK